MIRKIVRFLLYTVLSILFVGFIIYLFVDESKPNGTKGNDAEKLTNEVLLALNKPAFDTLSRIEFTFRNTNTYQWNKAEENVTVWFGDNEVLLDLSKGLDEYDPLQKDAYARFINDSFWLVAPFKIRDKGVLRSTVDLKEGRGLLVEYTSGGLTPGDAYLWVIDESGFPSAWKLWTSNVPVGGLEFSWDNWQKVNNVWFATEHSSKVGELLITDLKAY